jgi:hypothetical protein
MKVLSETISLKTRKKAVFSTREKIIPDVIRIVDLVLGFFIADGQDAKDSFDDVIDRVRGEPDGFEDRTKE